MNRGLLHLAHWSFFSVGLLLLLCSAVGVATINSRKQTERLWRQSLLDLLNGSATKLGEAPKKTKTWVMTYRRIAAHFRIYAGLYKNRIIRTLRGDNQGTSKYAAAWFAAFCCAILAYVALRPAPYPTYEYYNVEVQSRVAQNKWWMKKNDGRFLYQGCPDFPNERVIWVGYVAQKVRWEEQGNCKSILRSDLGFWWQRDESGNAKEIR